MSLPPELDKFLQERDEVLLAGDVDRMIAFHAKYNPDSTFAFPSREVAEAAMHKARTGCKSLPMEARLASKRWLRERNLSSFDEGELADG